MLCEALFPMPKDLFDAMHNASVGDVPALGHIADADVRARNSKLREFLGLPPMHITPSDQRLINATTTQQVMYHDPQFAIPYPVLLVTDLSDNHIIEGSLCRWYLFRAEPKPDVGMKKIEGAECFLRGLDETHPCFWRGAIKVSTTHLQRNILHITLESFNETWLIMNKLKKVRHVLEAEFQKYDASDYATDPDYLKDIDGNRLVIFNL